MIEKDVLLIVSPGRTGTAFLGRHLSEIVDDCWSAHEPDVWVGWLHTHSWRAIRWFGPWHVIVGKLIRQTGVRVAGERYASGEWSADRTVQEILRQRQQFIESRPASLVAESNYQWHSVLPLLPRIFTSYRVLALRAALGAVLDFGHRRYQVHIRSGILSSRANASRPRQTRGWEEWSDAQRDYLLETCGDAMEELGYLVPEDRKRIDARSDR